MKLLFKTETHMPGGAPVQLYTIELGQYDTVMFYCCDRELLYGVVQVHCEHLIHNDYDATRFFRAGYDHHFFGNHVLVRQTTLDSLFEEGAFDHPPSGESIPDVTFKRWLREGRF